MKRRELLAGAAALAVSAGSGRAAARRLPNFIVVLCDDLGYGDVGAFGGRQIPTPRIDQMAAEGVALTSYYAPANLCTPSRAGLLTGRYPVRTGLGYEVIMANDDRGLPTSEITIAKALKPDYVSGLFGKWHLGHRGPAWPPTEHGFDVFFGIPYSHDMQPLALFEARAGGGAPTSRPADLPTLQESFFTKAMEFIEANRARPFFVELALSAPHLPEHPRPPFEGSTQAGPYGDVVAEIDSIVGRLLDRLRALGLAEDTLVIFTSDNGPWFEGSAGGLRDRKGGAGFDGGYRVPFIAWRPGTAPAGRRCDSIACGIDLLPTFCAMSGRPPPAAELDGQDISAVLLSSAPSPHDALLLFDNETVAAIRTQRWKLVADAYYRGRRFPLALLGDVELYDMALDSAESYSVAASHPEVVRDLQARLTAARARFKPYRHAEVPEVFKTLGQALDRVQD